MSQVTPRVPEGLTPGGRLIPVRLCGATAQGLFSFPLKSPPLFSRTHAHTHLLPLRAVPWHSPPGILSPRVRAQRLAATVSLDPAVREEVARAILSRDEAAAGLARKWARWQDREEGGKEEARLRLGTMQVRNKGRGLGRQAHCIYTHYPDTLI